METDIDKFVHDQLSVWPVVAAKYRALKSAQTRQVPLGGILLTLQSNPGRLPVIDKGCPLCAENRPSNQHSFKFEGRKGRRYDVLVNRAPIFPNHLVITRDVHDSQQIWHRYVDMLDMAHSFQKYVIFYNGPCCGTSVSGHAHFQACPKGYMPLERVTERLLRSVAAGTVPDELEFIDTVRDAQLYHYKRFNRGIFMLRSQTAKSMAKLFYRLLDCLNLLAEEEEPRFNAFTYCSEGEYRTLVTLRSSFRPRCFYAEGEKHFAISPGAADMAGFVVVPEEGDFERLNADVLQEIYADVTLTEAEEKRLLWRLVRTQPKVEVGIRSAREIGFEIISDGAGPQKVSYREGKIDYNGVLYDELVFEAVTISTLFAEPSFILYTEEGPRRFAGTLKFMADKGSVEAVNLLGAEDYLLSVVSLLPEDRRREEAVAIRRRLMDRVACRGRSHILGPELVNTPEVITWLEHRPSGERSAADAPVHAHYDVCATGHCFRYEGLTPAADAHARAMIDETWGQLE